MKKGNLVHIDMSDDMDGTDIRIGTVIREASEEDGLIAENYWWVTIGGREELVNGDQIVKVIG